MKTQSIDTDAAAEKMSVSLLKKATPAKKFFQICSLSQTMIQLSKRAIARVNTDLSERRVNLLFVANIYGKNLAENLEKYLNKIHYENT